MVNKTDPLEMLDGAKNRDIPWTSLAQVLTKLEAESVLDEFGRTWARAAAERTGYTSNQLRQMQRTLTILDHLQKTHALDLRQMLEGLPFSHAEILARIAKADESSALEIIKNYMAGNVRPTYRSLREHFYGLRKAVTSVSPIAAGQTAAREFEHSCLQLIKETKATILPGFGNGEIVQILKWPGAFRYASPDIAIGMRNSDGALELDAVDCYAIYGDVSREETARRVAKVATESTFFRKFWILLPTWSVGGAVASMCDELGLYNVGVLDIDVDKRQTRSILTPSSGPYHNRQAMLTRDVARYFNKI